MARQGAIDPDWARTGVVYQIYPRSFADADGNGVGDLAGILAHLDHLAGTSDSLGVDAIWLSPIYPSPGLDGGYDVSNHAAIDPLFGTMADFERLVTEAHARDLRVILDLVLNHTSDRHPWFVDSRRGRTSEHASWYLWRDAAGTDARGRPIPPNNWVSFFGGSAWQWDSAREQFYLHTFLPQQPDLNWREPAVREAQFAMVRGWLDRGVDGFRLDVFNALLKAESLAANPARRRPARRPWDRQRHVYDKDQPELASLLADFRAIVDERPGRMTVGELFDGTLEAAAAMTVGHHFVFDFELLERPWSARAFGSEIDRRERAYGERWPAVVLSNHDQSRHVTRFLEDLGRSDAATADRVAKAAAVLLLTLRGTPFLYYGEEIGLPDVDVPRSEIVDPPARRASFTFPWWNRDRCRSPMPWTGGPNGGFTTGRPWIRMIPDIARRNVATEAADPASVLTLYRRLLGLRRGLPALHSGTIRRSPARVRDVLRFERAAPSDALPAPGPGAGRALILINFALTGRRAPLPAGRWRVAISTAPARPEGAELDGTVMLAGLEAAILQPAPAGDL